MTSWDRVNRLERDLSMAEARIRRLEGELTETLIVAGLEPFDGTTTHDRLRQQRDNVEALSLEVEELRERAYTAERERDRARATAVRLEQELAESERQLDELIELLEDDGDAQLALEVKLVELRGRHE